MTEISCGSFAKILRKKIHKNNNLSLMFKKKSPYYSPNINTVELVWAQPTQQTIIVKFESKKTGGIHQIPHQIKTFSGYGGCIKLFF